MWNPPHSGPGWKRGQCGGSGQRGEPPEERPGVARVEPVEVDVPGRPSARAVGPDRRDDIGAPAQRRAAGVAGADAAVILTGVRGEARELRVDADELARGDHAIEVE